MNGYLNRWRIIEGSLKERRINELPNCLEKKHLLQIREMLKQEELDPDAFCMVEYPASGIYCCDHINEGNYFIIQEYAGKLVPHYTTWKMKKMGIDSFPCKNIEEAIALTEYKEVKES